MSRDQAIAFRTNANKDYLRAVYDRSIIANWRERRGFQLRYLGLPGPDMLDIIEWQSYIGSFTTIERLENEQHLIFLRANVRDIEHRLHSLYGEFDQIILTGRDRYNLTPKWPYDLINLDHFGGFLYQDMSRPKAIGKLIANQGEFGHSFLLIVTHHLRDGDSFGEKISFFDDLGARIVRDYGRPQASRTFIEKYKESCTPDSARQALYMTIFLHDHGEMAHFQVTSRPPVVYSGTGGTKMIHYVTEFEYRRSGHRAVSAQSLHGLLNLGVLELQGEQFTPLVVPALRR